MALTGGFWMLEMWHQFRNPLFPYFNQYFQSPWGAIGSYRDERFIPIGWAQEWLFPIAFNFNPLQVGEVVFRDLRLPLLYLLLLVLLGQVLCQQLKRRKNAPTPATENWPPLTGFFVIFLVVAFVLWMKMFAVYRYAMICDFLAPLTIVLVLGALMRDPRRHLLFALIGLVCLVVTVQPGDWGRRAWTANYFDVRVPAIPDPQHTIILVAGHDSMAYMIPFFPPQVRFLRIQGYTTGPSPTPNETDRHMMRILAGHKGPVTHKPTRAEFARCVQRRTVSAVSGLSPPCLGDSVVSMFCNLSVSSERLCDSSCHFERSREIPVAHARTDEIPRLRSG